MLEALVYPVSAVMKLWHWLLADIFGMANSPAWVLSIVLLVFTVRGFLAPFTWALYRSGRMSMLMRPAKAAIAEKYAEETSAEAAKAEREETKELHKKYGYNPLAGCIPPLLQIPIVIGLYRLLRWMSIPSPEHANGIGLLSKDNVDSFLAADLFGAPLPASPTMGAEHLAALGTTADEVRAVYIPLVLMALVFTTVNMAISAVRSHTQTDWSSAIARGANKMIVGMLAFIPFMILIMGWSGVLPVALFLYWVTSNLWTGAQTAIFWFALVKKFPLDDEHKEHISTAKQAVRSTKQDKKDRKRAEKQRIREAKHLPGGRAAAKREIAAEKEAEKAAAAEEKARLKEIKRQRSKAHTEQILQERRERREAKKQEG